MLAKPATVLMLLLLGGCTIPFSKTSGIAAEEQSCTISGQQMDDSMQAEHQFLIAGRTERNQLKNRLKQKDDKISLALINAKYSQSIKLIDSSIAVLRQQQLFPSDNCRADRYLYLQLRVAQQRQEQLITSAAQQGTIQELQHKINALTDLEHQIMRQREDL